MFGVRPDRPETGYGYIREGEREERGRWAQVAEFVEKPDLATARERFQRIVDLGYDDAIFVLPDYQSATLDRLREITG